MTDSQFIFNVLNKQDMINVVAFMEENKEATLDDAIDWLYELVFIDGEDCIFERGHDTSWAERYNTKQFRTDALAYYGYDDEVVPF